jgi:hypothetical protein
MLTHTTPLPLDVIDLAHGLSYKDKFAILRQHFTLLLVNREWHAFYTSAVKWRALFSHFFLWAPRADLTLAKAYLREVHLSGQLHRVFYAMRKEHSLGYDPTTKKLSIGKGEITKLRKMPLTHLSTEIQERYRQLMGRINGNRATLSRLKSAITRSERKRVQ